MSKLSLKHGLWLLIMVTSIAGVFFVKGEIYTKLSRDSVGGLTLPSYTLPIFAIAIIFVVERIRSRYPDTIVNIVLGIAWIAVIGLIVGNT